MFEPQALAKGLDLQVMAPEICLPIWTDATKVKQILINLVGNAMKFTEEGVVGVELTPASDRVSFVVRDTGPGIRQADLGRIFDPFTQLNQTHKRVKGGTGLGLAVSQKLAHLLGGELSVASMPNEGATFTVWLPLRYQGTTSDDGDGQTEAPVH